MKKTKITYQITQPLCGHIKTVIAIGLTPEFCSSLVHNHHQPYESFKITEVARVTVDASWPTGLFQDTTLTCPDEGKMAPMIKGSPGQTQSA